MATNDFLPFGNGTGANVATLADYSSNSGYSLGYQSGVAQSKYLNRTWRQSSMMAAMIGQFMADNGVNAVDDGVIANLEAAFRSALNVQINNPVRVIRRQVFTASGTYNPTAGMVFVDVEILGGGASGGGSTGGSGTGSAGSGGGAGGYAKKVFTATQVGASAAVVVGAGGAAQGVGSNGIPGGASTFLSLTANGGGGGLSAPAATAIGSGANTSVGGLASGGDINVQGSSSGIGIGFGASGGTGGIGGSTQYGSGGPAAFPTGAGGNQGTGYGSGGSGSASTTTSYAGAKGNSGICIITEYCYQ